MVAHVLIEIKASSLDKTFTYNIPDDLKGKVKVGVRVIVPFSNRDIEGFVLKISDDKYDYELKNIKSVIDLEPVLNTELLELGKFVKKKTLCNLITAYQAMLPNGVKAKSNNKVNIKYESYLVLNNTLNIKNDVQKRIIDLFNSNDKILKSDALNISISATNTLIKNGNLSILKEEKMRTCYDTDYINEKKVLNDEQMLAFNTIKNKLNTFAPFLLHGVTGSGKTEIYMQVIEEVLKNNKNALVLVPEISLTPQFINNFKGRFGRIIATLHSGLSNGEKFDEWRRIKAGVAKVVIGARSSIFSPLENIGVIIIDEEHSSTYKQDNSPRYSAIDVALARAKYHNCPVILGSATPSLESYTRAKNGIYTLITLKNRANGYLPTVTLVDMKNEIRKGNRIISELLRNKIEEKLNLNEQVIILLNRRGYTLNRTCPRCGFTHKCPNCDIPLIYHKKSDHMTCHYCNYTVPRLLKCPKCGETNLRDMGLGTEKLEQYITETIKNAKVVRMDNDTTRTKGSYEKIINDFKDNKHNILIGTQMISKGLDFPNVTLAAVLSCDSSLSFPDFRSSERTFELLSQVAGRSGRKKEGIVIFQGFNVEHYSIICAKNHDYESFYKKEMDIRSKLNYSPYFNITAVKVRGKIFDIVKEASEKIAYHMRNNLNDVNVLGPSSSIILKKNNIYELNIVLKYKKSENVMKELNFIQDMYRSDRKVTVDIDISPLFI